MKFAVEVKKGFTSVVTGTVLAASLGMSSLVVAGDLAPQDLIPGVTTIIDKSIISGEVAHDPDTGALLYDSKGNVRFIYSGTVHAVDVDKDTGELVDMSKPIGTINGEAAFPYMFVMMSAGINGVMNGDYTMQQLLAGFGGMPPVVPWTCNHCKMVVGDTTYVSIVDALDPSDPYGMRAMFDGVAGKADGALEAMRLDGRAFTGETPVSFDPVNRTMSLSMAGCSAVVGVPNDDGTMGSNTGKIGTLCMNSTATFDISGATGRMTETGFVVDTSIIKATGSSNCVTVLHTPLPM